MYNKPGLVQNNHKKILFIYSSFLGHLIKSLLIAKYYLSKGYTVTYFIHDEFAKQFMKQFEGFNIIPSSTNTINYEALKLLQNDFSATALEMKFQERKQEILTMMEMYKPSLIFLDEFCTADFLFLAAFTSTTKIIVLSTFLPSFPNDNIPPQFIYAFPGNASAIWKDYPAFPLQEDKVPAVFDMRNFILHKFREEGIQDKYHIWNFNGTYPSFSALEKWYLIPEEIEFRKQDIKPWEKYMGPMTDLTVKEETGKIFSLFIKKAKSNPVHKMIYVSLGTVIQSFLKQDTLMAFYRQLMEISFENPHWYFFIKIPGPVLPHLKASSLNMLLFNTGPHLELLKMADLLITHGGGSSVYEAIYMNTPMLVLPPATHYDYNGNAARLVFHGMAEKADVTDTKAVIINKINLLLYSSFYLEKITLWKQMLLEKYPQDYIEKMDMPIP